MVYPIVKYFKNSESFLKLLDEKEETIWLKRGEIHTLKLFKEVVKFAPADKKFLKREKILINSIKNMSDFSKISTTDKKNYLQFYNFAELVPG